MKKMSKLLSVAFIMAIAAATLAAENSPYFKNQKFEQLKKTMWFSGVSNISMGDVPSVEMMEANFDAAERVELPEELTRPLMKKVRM